MDISKNNKIENLLFELQIINHGKYTCQLSIEDLIKIDNIGKAIFKEKLLDNIDEYDFYINILLFNNIDRKYLFNILPKFAYTEYYGNIPFYFHKYKAEEWEEELKLRHSILPNEELTIKQILRYNNDTRSN